METEGLCFVVERVAQGVLVCFGGDGCLDLLWFFPKNKERKRMVQAAKVDKLSEQWVPHVAKMEAGEIMTLDDIYEGNVERQRKKTSTATDLAFLPTLVELEDVLRGTTAGKMCGPDQS